MVNQEDNTVYGTPERIDESREHVPDRVIEAGVNAEEIRKREDMRRLSQQADAYMGQVKLAGLERKVSPHESFVVSEHLPATSTMETVLEEQKQACVQTSFRERLKHKARSIEWRLGGVKESEELDMLVYYLEHHLTDVEDKVIKAKKEKAEETAALYEKQGYAVNVWDAYESTEGDKELHLSRLLAYKVSRSDAKRLQELVGQSNDPIEMIERMRHIGFSVTPDTIRDAKNMRYIKDIVESPEIADFIKKMEAMGATLKYGSFVEPGYLNSRGNTVGDMEAFVGTSVSREMLDDATVGRLAAMKKAGLDLALHNFDTLGELVFIAADKNFYEAITNFRKDLPVYRINDLTENLLFLQKQGVLEKLRGLAAADPKIAELVFHEFPKESIYSYSDAKYYEDKRRQMAERIEKRMQSEDIVRLSQDKGWRDMVMSFSALRGRGTPSPEDIEFCKSMANPQMGLVFAGLCRENGVTFSDKDLKERGKALTEMLNSEHAFSVLADPEFKTFIKRVSGELGYQTTLNDFISPDASVSFDGELLTLFQDEKKRSVIMSEHTPELINIFGSFDMRRIGSYRWILETPRTIDALRILPSFDIDPKELLTNIGNLEYLIKLSRNESFVSRLANPATVEFYQNMKNVFGYRSDVGTFEPLVEMAEDKEFIADVFSGESAAFIRKTFDLSSEYDVLRILKDIKKIDSPMRRVIEALHEDFGFQIDYGFDGDLPKLRALTDFPIMLQSARNLHKNGFQFDVMEEFEKFKNTIGYGMQDMIVRQKNNPHIQRFIFDNPKTFADIPKEKLEDYLTVFMSIDDSPSQEVQRLRDSLLRQLLHTTDPMSAYRKIESIFIKNNLPAMGKAYKIFDTLYSPEEIDQKLHGGLQGSPVLTGASRRHRRDIIYRDLLNIHIDSGNRSLRQYAEVLQSGESVLRKVDEGGIEALSPYEQRKFRALLGKFNTLFINSSLGKNKEEPTQEDLPLGEQYDHLKQSLGIVKEEKIMDRISVMFLRPVGAESVNEMLARMKNTKQRAHERSIHLADEAKGDKLLLNDGDFLKGVDAPYIGNILQNGSVAREYLGASSGQDSTPLDTDVARVSDTQAEAGMKRAIEMSMAKDYGELMLVVKDRGQFQHTGRESASRYDPKHLELFETGGGQHYGIRTGFPSTEIDFMIAREPLKAREKDIDKIYYEVAQNGFYIPITDAEGTIVFTPDMYGEYRNTFNGLDRFDGDALPIEVMDTNDSLRTRMEDILKSKESDNEYVSSLSQTLRSVISEMLEARGVALKDEFDSSLLGAELLDIGSTGRHTNMPGDADFDFNLKLDVKDFGNAEEIAKEILSTMKLEKNNSHAGAQGYYQLRANGVTKIGNTELKNPIDIDIGFAKKSDLSVYGSYAAVSEKLDWITRNKGEGIKDEVVANIVLAKKILKEGGAYKQSEQGGLGGIGVENWILAHEGNVRSACKSFYDAAHEDGKRISFDAFKKKYRVLNAGMNMKELIHDNYVLSMSPEGYQNMLNAIESVG